MANKLPIKKCEKCRGRSFMNGFCLTCEADKANAANRKSRGGDESLVDHAFASMKTGFVK